MAVGRGMHAPAKQMPLGDGIVSSAKVAPAFAMVLWQETFLLHAGLLQSMGVCL